MKNNKVIVLVISLIFTVAIGGIFLANTIIERNADNNQSKSAYQLYCETHPNYNKTEAEWLDDLINGRLAEKTNYTVSFNSVGGTAVKSQTVESGSKITKPENPTKLGYTFNSWQYRNEEWMFNGYVVTEDIQLVASWDINKYSITYDYNGGLPEQENPTQYTVNSDFELSGSTRLGYTFAGWYNGDTLMNSIKPGTTGDLNLIAHWTADKHVLKVTSQNENQGSVNIVSGIGYTDEEITINATSISPFVFKSWCDKEGNIISLENPYTFQMPSNDYELVAHFAELRGLTLDIDDAQNGTIAGAGEHIIGSDVTIECVPNENKVFKGWYDSSDVLQSTFLKYTFQMPSDAYYLKAVFMDDAEIVQNEWDIAHGVVPHLSEDKTSITYGMYPQRVVDDDDLNLALFENATFDSATGFYTYNGEYYAKLTAKPFDFTGYVDESTIYEENFDNGKEIVFGNMYWYYVKPINWIICNQEGTTYTLMSELLLDTRNFNSTEYNRLIDEQTVYPNNYKYSSARSWLNEDFYNSAFALSNSYIQTTAVDNSVESTGVNYNPYCCEDTNDKVFLPSVQEIKNYVQKGISASAYTSDYVRSKSVYYSIEDGYLYYCDYWTRSPASGDSKASNRVHSNGYINGCGVKVGSYCVRPCITIEYI